MDSLERALVALDAGNDVAALVALVEAWRDRRSPHLAELVELLDSRQVKRPFASILTPQVKSTVSRLRALADSDDPRLGTFLLDALGNPPFTTVSSRPFWQLVFDIALALRDPRIRDQTGSLRKLATRRFASAPLRAHVMHGISRLESQEILVRDPTEPERSLEAEIASRLDKIRSAKRREHELLAEIYADPYADGPRLVYADVLLERGDPRGELISLQFERRAHGLDEKKAAREAELLARHAKRWLGNLAAVVAPPEGDSETRFERGFLCVASILQKADKMLPLTWNDVGWSTVEELRGAHQETILRHAALFALRKLSHLSIADVVALGDRPTLPHLADIEVVTTGLEDRGRDVLARCAGLDALRTLRLVTGASETTLLRDALWILGSPVAERLERFVLRSHAEPVTPRAAALEARPLPDWFRRVVDEALALPATVPTLVLVPPREPDHAWPPVELHRDESGVYRRA